MSQWLQSLRAFASPVEFGWTAFALLGLLIGLFVLRESALTLWAVVRTAYTAKRHREALRDFRTSLAFVLIFLVFSEIGLAALLSPPPVYAAARRVTDLIALTLLVAEPFLVWAKWANWRDESAALDRAERREGAD